MSEGKLGSELGYVGESGMGGVYWVVVVVCVSEGSMGGWVSKGMSGEYG